MRFLLPIPLPRRQPATPGNPTRRRCTLCCPLSHLLVVVANTLQLAMMVAFLCLLLLCMEGAPISWFVVFAPLWVSDSITLVNSAHEFYRVWRARPEAFTSQRNALIAQVNRLKGSVGVATFKFLLAMRQARARRPRTRPRLVARDTTTTTTTHFDRPCDDASPLPPRRMASGPF